MADETPADLALLAPEVRTLACPASETLLAARTAVQHSQTLRAAFERARQENRTPEQLAGDITPELERLLDAQPHEVIPAAQYLADEYLQIGDALLVIDRETGRAIARFTDADLWTPAPIPREGGGMAQPLPRLRPDLQGFLISYYFDQAKDRQLLAKVQERYPQTLALRDQGNPRLRAVTRAGRANMVDELRQQLPTLLGAVQGAAKGFLDHLPITDQPPQGFAAIGTFTAVARSRQSVADPLTMNIRHDQMRALGARIGTSWVRSIAATVASKVEHRRTTHGRTLDREALGSAGFWVVPPYTHTVFRSVTEALAVEGVEPTGLDGVVGALVIDPEQYSVAAREVFSRWEVSASLLYTLYLDTSKLTGLLTPDIPVEALAEIL